MSQLSKEDYLRLSRKYNIRFEGRIIPEKWGEYAPLFNKIRSIGSITTAEFVQMHDEAPAKDDPYFEEKKIMVSKLVEGAWSCLKNMDSEIGWREMVEYKALERFSSAVVW